MEKEGKIGLNIHILTPSTRFRRKKYEKWKKLNIDFFQRGMLRKSTIENLYSKYLKNYTFLKHNMNGAIVGLHKLYPHRGQPSFYDLPFSRYWEFLNFANFWLWIDFYDTLYNIKMSKNCR